MLDQSRENEVVPDEEPINQPVQNTQKSSILNKLKATTEITVTKPVIKRRKLSIAQEI